MQNDGLDNLKEILGMGEDEDIFENAANGPINIALVSSSVLSQCLARRDEYSLNYNCKVGIHINIKTEQECVNIGCVYAPGNLCFRCPLIKTTAESNQLPIKSCSIEVGDRGSCPGFSSFYAVTSIFGRSANNNNNQQQLLQAGSNSAGGAGAGGSPSTGGAVLGSRSGAQAPETRQGFSSMFGGGSSQSSMQQMLMQQMMANNAGSSSSFGGGSYNPFGSSSFGMSQQSSLQNVVLKNKCESMGCCWDDSQNYFGVSANSCFKKTYAQSDIKINNDNCYDAFTCGKSSQGIFSRIVGGTSATSANDRPWQVLIRSRGNPLVRCSGVLICNQWVITTASCLIKVPTGASTLGYFVSVEPGSLEAYVGSIDPANPQATGSQVAIERIVPHPNYVVTQNVHDVALIKIQPLNFQANIKPVCLPTFASSSVASNTDIFVAGYGSAGNAFLQRSLREIKLKTINYADCKSVYKSSLPLGSVFCAEPTTPGEDTCKGDGGSPALVYNAALDMFTLVGLNFGGSLKCTADSPVVFTDIARYRFWITQTTNGCCTSTGDRVTG